jgi:dTDP-4-amino-4,6-dideoxygalactose transaminase
VSSLAILGGDPVFAAPIPKYPSIGADEKAAVMRVMDSGCLSGFFGSPRPEFYGGPEVRAFEAEWAARFRCGFAVSVNSNTSGLVAALGAIGLSPGDEVIVSPYTMSATAMAPLAYGGIPVFSDVEDETFNLNVAKAAAKIGPRTKAILVTNLFGHPAELVALRKLCDGRGVYLIEDNAQGPLAAEAGRYAGTIGHIGVFSLNYHKHIHTGEGGVCTTDDAALAERLALIRNHGENLVEAKGIADIANLFGFNLRLSEMSAAVGRVQLRNADRHVGLRVETARRLSEGVSDLAGIQAPVVRAGCDHVYYTWSVLLDDDALGVPRDVFCRAVAAEGVPLVPGYVKPLYHLPVFQRRVAMGRDGFPFTLSNRSYDGRDCPVAEDLHNKRLALIGICDFAVEAPGVVDGLVRAIRKVHAERESLRGFPAR